ASGWHAGRLARWAGGFVAEADPACMIGQIHLLNVPDPSAARHRLEAATRRLLAAADAVHPNLVRRGGGARAIELRELGETSCGPVLLLHLVVDVGDAMGANILNTMGEARRGCASSRPSPTAASRARRSGSPSSCSRPAGSMAARSHVGSSRRGPWPRRIPTARRRTTRAS